MNNAFNICYVIIDEPSRESHFLKGSIFERSTIDALKLINRLPISVPELFCSMEERASIRLSSIYPGRIIHFQENLEKAASLFYNFKIIFTNTPESDKKTHDDIFFISLRDIENNPDLLTLSDSILTRLRIFFLEKIKNKHPVYNDLPGNLSKQEIIAPRTKIKSHISTLCNIEILRSIGIEPELSEPNEIAPDRSNTEHSVNLINFIKNEISTSSPTELRIPSADYLVTDFSIDFEYSINTKDYSKHNLMKQNTPNHALVADSITHAKSTPTIVNNHDNHFIDKYHSELYFGSLINAIYASSTLTPELRLGVCNNDLFPITSSMGNNIRANNTTKLHRLMAKFTAKVIEGSDTLLDYLSNSTNKQIKIVSNFPIEWTNLNGLPLMIRHNVSRVFSTPGFLRETTLLQNNELHLNIDSFRKILIVSSFPPGDRISQDLKQAITKIISAKLTPEAEKRLQEAQKNGAFVSDFNPEIVFKTVRKKEELINTLNEFPYALVVFDMHGGHHSDSQGHLLLSDGPLYPQELSGVAAIPPIVILSACDTSPADRNHYNVANAFLCAGAKTVLASTYPILSKDAAQYIARLYLRIKLYLPERILSVKRSIRWSEFITGLNRRVYIGSFVNHIIKKYKISGASAITELMHSVHHTLEVAPASFLDQVLFDISRITGLSIEALKLELSTHFTYSECMNYVQIGFPEKILIQASDISLPTQ